MTEHTPGDLRAYKRSIHPENRPETDIGKALQQPGMRPGEAEANARLWASAPDLLAALEPFAELFSEQIPENWPDSRVLWGVAESGLTVGDFRRAAAAAAKARGEG